MKKTVNIYMKIIDNFLPQEEFNKIQNIIMGEQFNYFYKNYVTSPEDTDYFYFAHELYKDNVPQSDYINLLQPLFTKLKILSLIRAKVNCFPRTEKLIKYGKHVDKTFKHKGAIFYINTCNGGTYVKDKFIKSVANRMLLFDSSKAHQSTNCTDEKCRFNININYF
mgnify:CR=1 FL=1|tara:strand:- start:483 stop:980 length:498 start_codon:yes stop_codon:yes gene_type:complete